jgi:hypothetical protein
LAALVRFASGVTATKSSSTKLPRSTSKASIRTPGSPLPPPPPPGMYQAIAWISELPIGTFGLGSVETELPPSAVPVKDQKAK